MKETVLYNIHKESGATLSEFSGYNMPLWYTSAIKEHINVLEHVGIFDTSHMSTFIVKGREALSLLNRAFSRDLKGLNNSRMIYGLFLKSDSSVLDDAIIYRWDRDVFMVVVNAGMSLDVIAYLKCFKYHNYHIIDFTNKVAKIDIQGPKSLSLMSKIYGNDLFDKFPYFSFKGDFLHRGVLISRSGYTGEFGFELFMMKDQAATIWKVLLQHGKEFGILPCGLAARDSLRVGALLPLSHQDIGNWPFVHNPWSFAIDSNMSDSLEKKPIESYTYPFIGMDLRKLRDGAGEVLLNNTSIGVVLTCITEPSITRYNGDIVSITDKKLPKDLKIKGLSAGFIKVDRALDYGTILKLSDGRRLLDVEVVKDIRPNRTACWALDKIRSRYE